MLFDFDGTLSEVVDDPAAARPRAGAVEHLEGLCRRYRRVGVISGRPVSFLVEHLPSDLYLSGLYGMQEWADGVVQVPEEFRRWAEVIRAARGDLLAALDGADLAGVEVEDKQLSLTVHYRARPDLADSVLALADAVAASRGLGVGTARMSVELHPPVPVDKGSVVRSLIDRLARARTVDGVATVESLIFVGDDVGDLPAFTALDELAAQGLTTAAIAVRSSEMDPRMAQQADVVIDGSGVIELLRTLRFGAGVDG